MCYRQILLSVVFVAALIASFQSPQSALGESSAQRTYRIGLVQMTDTVVYNDAVEGVRARLAELGYERGRNLEMIRRVVLGPAKGIWDKAQLLFALKRYIAEFCESGVDLVVTVGTPATVYGAESVHDCGIPVVFTAVAVGESIEFADEPWITGTTTFVHPERLLRLVHNTMPGVKRIGVTASDDANAQNYLKYVRESAVPLGFELDVFPVSTNADAYKAAEHFTAHPIDAFLVIPDTWLARDEGVNAKVMGDHVLSAQQIVVFSTVWEATEMFPEFVALAVGVPFRESGVLAADMIDKVFKGATPGSLPVLNPPDPGVRVRVETARRNGMPITPALLKLAEDVRQ